MKQIQCPICNCEEEEYFLNVDAWKFSTYGFNKKYMYKKCAECGCLYRVETNIDYDELYNNETYTVFSDTQNDNVSLIKKMLIKIRDSYVFMGKHKWVGKLLNHYRPSRYNYLSEYRDALKSGASFLDVGCGKGKMAHELKEVGANVYGTEPYLNSEIIYSNGLRIQKKFISEISEQYDIVFLDNVFEHLDSPLNDLLAIKKILNINGICGLIFPGFGQMLDEYKENAYTIQAPQHSCLHTEKSIRILANKAGMSVKKIIRQPVEAWYIKSYLLKKGIEFHENENLDELKQKLSSEEYVKLLQKIQDALNNGTGDMYHVMLMKGQ